MSGKFLKGSLIDCNLPSRGKLYSTLGSGIIAEVGVWCGDNSKRILRHAKPEKLYLIDRWEDLNDTYKSDNFYFVKGRFVKRDNVEVIKGDGIGIISQFDDDHFDWIYIDADHRYESSLAELEVFASKVKPNGFLAGHDYDTRHGVFEAVNDFCRDNNWEMIYLTADKRNNSYAIRRREC